MAAPELSTQIQTFTERCKDDLGSGVDVQLRRKLFGEYAKLWNDAEAAGNEDALGKLKLLRPTLKLPRTHVGAIQKASMVFRLFLTLFVASFGCVCLAPIAFLRLANPWLRKFGIQNGRLPADIGLYLWGKAVLAAMGVKVKVHGDGIEKKWANSSCGLITYNHTSNVDPFVVNLICRAYAPKYVGKQVLFKLPVIGWVFLMMGMVPINRGDREKAIATMNKCVASIMEKWGRCVAVAPEGTRTTDGHLGLPFKKGAFHLQTLTTKPLMPVVIYGGYELWPPKQIFTKTGEVTVEFLPPQLHEKGETDTSRMKLQRSVAECLALHPEIGSAPLSAVGWLENCFVLSCTGAVFWLNGQFYSKLFSAMGLGAGGSAALFATASISMAFYVDRM